MGYARKLVLPRVLNYHPATLISLSHFPPELNFLRKSMTEIGKLDIVQVLLNRREPANGTFQRILQSSAQEDKVFDGFDPSIKVFLPFSSPLAFQITN